MRFWLLQDFGLIERYTVEKNVMLPAIVHGFPLLLGAGQK